MGISKQSIEDLKNKSKISDFILSSTTGKLRGNKGMALCPFHGEKTASMSFTDEENLFHCFGCKEGGDMFIEIGTIIKSKTYFNPSISIRLGYSNEIGGITTEDDIKYSLEGEYFMILGHIDLIWIYKL